MNTITKAIAILAVTLMTSACNTKQQSMQIYSQSQAYLQQTQMAKQTLPSEKIIINAITTDQNNRLNCGDAFKGVADCNIVTGKN